MQRVNPRVLIGLVLLAALPFVLPNYWLYLVTSIIISSILTSSVGLVTGMAGMVSLCQLAFAGIGGWVVSYFNANDIGVPFVLQVLLGGIVAVPIGVFIGLPALRVRGVNLAVVTLGFAAIMDLVFTIVNFPGGTIGKPVLRPDFLSSDKSYYWFCLVVFTLVMVGLNWLYRGRLGNAWLAVKHSERATAALGLSVPQTKLLAFAVSAFVAGLSGGLMAGQLGLLSASNFAPVAGLVLFAAAVLVGARYPQGAMLAGTMAWLVPEILNRLHLPQDLGNLIFAVGTIQALKDGGGVFEVINRNRKLATTLEIAKTKPVISSHNIQEFLNPKPVLEIQNLTVTYGQVMALNHVNIRLLEGQVMGLIGPNGAGKSSLVDAVTGFTGYQGSVLLAGANLDSQDATHRARLGLRRSFQQDRTVGELSAKAYLELSASKTLSKTELLEALEFAHLENPNLELQHLDVGTRRLLEVAGVLAARPKVVLFDEPAAGLSSRESLALGQRIASIPSRYGCAVLLIEHDMEVVRAACQEVTVLDFGSLILQGKTNDVLSSKAVIAAYLGEEVSA
jgi:branched-chain amino acid transport system permease protein